MPRRVFTYASNLQPLNDISSVSAFLLGASFLIFIANFVWSIYIDPVKAADNPWDSWGLEWQTSTPVPLVQLRPDPGRARRPVPLWRAGRPSGGRPGRAHRSCRSAPSELGEAVSPSDLESPPGEPDDLDPRPPIVVSGDAMADRIAPDEGLSRLCRRRRRRSRTSCDAHEGALWTGSRLLIGIWAFAFAALAFAYFYLRSANNEDLWRPSHITAPTAVGAAVFAFSLAAAFALRLRAVEVPSRLGARLGGLRLDRGSPCAHCRSACRSGS